MLLENANIELRKIQESDRESIRRAAKRALRLNQNYKGNFLKDTWKDIDTLLDVIYESQDRCAIIDECFFLMCDVGEKWSRPGELVLMEELILRLKRTGTKEASFDRVVHILKVIARKLGCVSISFGTDLSHSDTFLGNKLKKNGFVKSSEVYEFKF